MYKFLLRPRWLAFHLLCLAGIVLMVNLSLWQFRRLDEREQLNAAVEARSAVATRPVEELLPDTEPVPGDDALDAREWYTTIASGTYDAAAQVIVVNRSQGGQAGQNVVTPLVLDDGRLLLVNRGFVPLAAAVPPPPEGTVVVEGRLRVSQERSLGQLSDPAEGTLAEVLRIDIERLARQLDAPVVPMYVDLIASQPAEGDLPIPVPEPELGNGPHLSYAIQWIIFATSVAVGWVLAVRWSVRKRAERT